MLITDDVAPICVREIETGQVFESGGRVGRGGKRGGRGKGRGSDSGEVSDSGEEEEGKGGVVEEKWEGEGEGEGEGGGEGEGKGKGGGKYRGYYYVCETPVLEMIQSLPELLKEKKQAPTRPKSWFAMEEENREVYLNFIFCFRFF